MTGGYRDIQVHRVREEANCEQKAVGVDSNSSTGDIHNDKQFRG